jgi:hypothetical protein
VELINDEGINFFKVVRYDSANSVVHEDSGQIGGAQRLGAPAIL